MVQRFAVIGNPVEHSLSPLIHQQFAQQMNLPLTYEKIKGDDHSFEHQVLEFFNQGGKGLNVTLPYKKRAFELARVHTPRCTLAGAANTLWMKDAVLYADNTDGIGLICDLTRMFELRNKNILILGSGGATRGILYPLLEMKPDSLTVANRTVEKAKELQKAFPQIKITGLDLVHGDFDLILNATSASLEGHVLSLPEEIMRSRPLCYDLAYNQKGMTPFVRYARAFGCLAVDGLGMLVEQAAEAFYIWNEVKPSTAAVIEFLRPD
ncbi:shikimate dehydrogenase [Legionella bononiensis]|uniref:Shikimate dehydrogenase (NADP(+)) n=1 Tax=Legionella bononiensis TaxID=2793102 RepID=A0ABS1WG52_9GAMM|nr:shikimate dehydrogenase [Legionella bononiensis]MBL7481791.1 shikimate dehydrogenase [Legionella bononiensis]MBL7528340.1 shikimate dehydrogenase [Legionella bononiensis]MBL7564303.1 shikimate dehydrogenase [Legionella bononiensis]